MADNILQREGSPNIFSYIQIRGSSTLYPFSLQIYCSFFSSSIVLDAVWLQLEASTCTITRTHSCPELWCNPTAFCQDCVQIRSSCEYRLNYQNRWMLELSCCRLSSIWQSNKEGRLLSPKRIKSMHVDWIRRIYCAYFSCDKKAQLIFMKLYGIWFPYRDERHEVSLLSINYLLAVN